MSNYEIEIEGEIYPPADRQAPSNRKYMNYDSIQTGAVGKAAPKQ
jgi:hypothetical protein